MDHVQDEEEEEEADIESESGLEEQRKKSGKPKKLLLHLRFPGVPNSPPIIVKVRVDDCLIGMEVDTGWPIL